VRHFLVTAHGVNHAARRKEQQAFEERVRHQVEHAGSVGADAEAQEHVAQLRDGGVGENFFDVRLHQADGRGVERGERANQRNDEHRDGRAREKRIHARDHVHAGGDHRRGVNQRADWRGTFHRVRQPDI
jgi:hypothetical protein